MDDLVILISKFLVSWLAVQVVTVILFMWYLNSGSINLPDEHLPKTAVLLCLRGADPFLGDCLRSLLQQNYPQYHVKLIIDSEQDPAWQVAEDVINEVGITNISFSPLRYVLQSCSLKCSSLVQAVSELDDSYKVVALVDADTVVHANWLRELVSPLLHPSVGATTGNRWYLPTGKYWGTLVRYIWNVSAMVQMYLYGIPWGGTLAVKTEVLHQTGLLERWGQAFGEDTMIRSVLAKYNLKVKFVPSLIMLNQEECDLPSLKYWFQRQLLASRLYHPWWWAVVADAVFTILMPQILLMVWFFAFMGEDGNTATFALSWYVIYITALVMLMLFLELVVQSVISSQGKPVTRLSVPLMLRMWVGMPLTHWIYGWAMVTSWRMETVNWRGVSYEVYGAWNIHLLEYRPYHSSDQPSDRQISL
ncbi:glycosyltransferase [Anabaena azotica]|uniref:Glycosyltransferase family 2 protein n=1 Tax=Anabaena azotica FACHB-119 TaxID=947527 RepID=A0ABR8D508_9NOST|nr:glycosyltransferase family 2 protein [Anabaena azotica]MBD2501784.1 glycosyltransferase family 2 protein [Anabaena azotica FACHB-119]